MPFFLILRRFKPPWPAAIVWSLGVFLVSLNILIWRIDSPCHIYFDELRYIPAAKSMIGSGINENWSHPPFAKALIGLGLLVFGDQPLGWRIMSVLFGASSMVILFRWTSALFKSRAAAFATLILLMTNHLHFAQSRIAMLDVFMMTFMLGGLACFWRSVIATDDHSEAKTPASLSKNEPPVERGASRNRLLGTAGVCFGLSASCKWFGFVASAFCFVWFITATRKTPLLKRALTGASWFGLLPTIVYLFASLIILNLTKPVYETRRLVAPTQQAAQTPAPTMKTYSLPEIIQIQPRMLEAQLGFSNARQPYQSNWLSWPLALHPVWYDFHDASGSAGDEINTIFLTMNPAFAILSVIALAACLYLIVRRRADRDLIFLLSCYLVLWIPWAFVGRTKFLYYYYPASIILSIILVKTARTLRLPQWLATACLVIVTGVFLFYLPTLTYQTLDSDAFFRRLILPSWRTPPRL